MRLPMKVHAVKIRYREQLLRKMVHGRFGIHQGRRCVFISYIPADDKPGSRVKKRYYLDSSKGKEFTPKIKKYLSIKSEYDRLLDSWNSTYAFEPPVVRFPITNTYDPHHMDNRFFADAVDCSNNMPNDNPVYSGDDVLKSKNEQFGKGFFKKLGIPYKYEVALDVANPDGYVPDFLLSFYEIDRCVYAEICGMNDKSDYAATTSRKINFYAKNRYRPGREIVYVFMYDKYNFDEEYFAAQVLSAFDTLIPDSAIEWDNCPPPRIYAD